MNCSEFEKRLVETLAAETAATAETDRVLRAHAAACPHCRDALPLVTLASLPPAERDPVPLPPAPYWDSLRGRIEADIAGETPLRRAGAMRLAWAAAVVLAAAFAALQFVERPGGTPAGGVATERPVGEAPSSLAIDLRDGIDAAFDRALELPAPPPETDAAPPHLDSGDFWSGLDGEPQGLLPDLETLTDEQKANLTRWLEEQRRSDGGRA